MAVREVSIEMAGVVKKAFFECDRKRMVMKVTMPDGISKSYAGVDFYVCLGKVRQEYSDIKFLCKGSKINVHPSRMSSQMSNGIVAYELRWGEVTEDSDVVNIFDYEDENLTNDIREQVDYYGRWMESFDCKDITI